MIIKVLVLDLSIGVHASEKCRDILHDDINPHVTNYSIEQTYCLPVGMVSDKEAHFQRVKVCPSLAIDKLILKMTWRHVQWRVVHICTFPFSILLVIEARSAKQQQWPVYMLLMSLRTWWHKVFPIYQAVVEIEIRMLIINFTMEFVLPPLEISSKISINYMSPKKYTSTLLKE